SVSSTDPGGVLTPTSTMRSRKARSISVTSAPPAPAVTLWCAVSLELRSSLRCGARSDVVHRGDVFGGPGQEDRVVGDLDIEVTAGVVHDDIAAHQPPRVGSSGGRGRPRAARLSLPRPALPPPQDELVTAGNRRGELDVDAARPQLLQLRAHLVHVHGDRVRAEQHEMRVAQIDL